MTYLSVSLASVLRGRTVRREKGWPRGRNGNGLVECNGVRYVTPLRALRKEIE